MKNRLIIRDGLVVLENEVLKRDILIVKNRIEKISPSLGERESIPVLDAKNRFVLPGGIDAHTHMELDAGAGAGGGLLSADDYRNGSRFGLLGGITSFFGFAYQNAGERLAGALEREEKKAQKSFSPCQFHAGISRIGQDLDEEIKECVKAGCRSFKIHMDRPDTDSVFLLELFRTLFKYNGTAFLHCEDGRIIDHLKKRFAAENRTDLVYYPRTREDYVERLAIDTAINLARKFETRIYIAHLSSKLGLASLQRAREESEIWIEAETCPQYLLFTERMYKESDGYLYTCSPSFKHKVDSDALWNGLKKGIIKVVSSDHCPFMRGQKQAFRDDFTRLPLGLPGIGTLYPLLLSEGRKRKIKIQEIVKWVSTNPAKIFGLYPRKGVIRKNAEADLVIYNPEDSYRITSDDLLSSSDYSPYENWKISGRIETVILQGRPAVKNGRFALAV